MCHIKIENIFHWHVLKATTYSYFIILFKYQYFRIIKYHRTKIVNFARKETPIHKPDPIMIIIIYELKIYHPALLWQSTRVPFSSRPISSQNKQFCFVNGISENDTYAFYTRIDNYTDRSECSSNLHNSPKRN